MKRILLGALVGGIIVFAWSAVQHMATPLGMAGMRVLPDEEPVLGALRSTLREPGLYIFPGMDMSKTPTPEEQAAWAERSRTGPTGIAVIYPQGREPAFGRELAMELLFDILAALLVAFGLAHVAAGYGRRVLLVASAGVFAWLAISASYWNWYGFPDAYVAAEGLDQVVGWLLAGLALAKIVPPTLARAA
jgi:hypothetical protein